MNEQDGLRLCCSHTTRSGFFRVQAHIFLGFFCKDPPVVRAPRGGGGTRIFSYILMLRPFFGFKILNFNYFLGFQKNEYIFGV